ncbi:glycosyltransferase family 2 protein [Vibrio splendidus]
MKVSIIMPTYNVCKIVIDSIYSVINQTHKNWELIIIDDASQDDTAKILREIEGIDDRVKVHISPVNQGAGISRNLGLEMATGRYVAFLDSDDIWVETKLEVQLEHMSRHNAAISHTSFMFIDEYGQERSGNVSASEFVDLQHNLKFTEIGTSTAMLDLEIIGRSVRFDEIRSRQDLKLWIDLLGRGFISYGLNETLVKYRVRSGSVSSNKIKMLLVTLKVYLGIKHLSLFDRLSCYSQYVMNAIKKRNA